MLYKLKQVIEFYEWCLGQKVNWKKLILCGINIEEDELVAMAATCTWDFCWGLLKTSIFLATGD